VFFVAALFSLVFLAHGKTLESQDLFATPVPVPFAATVIEVSDGDTVWVEPTKETPKHMLATSPSKKKTGLKLRLAYIDAPEFAHHSFGRKWEDQPFCLESKVWLSSMILDKSVQVHPTSWDVKDKRLVAVLRGPDGTNVNRASVAAGMAWTYTQYNKDTNLPLLQTEAKASDLGLWIQKDPAPTYPSIWRGNKT
jgi:endonuclease YncB( thermonuclease family)